MEDFPKSHRRNVPHTGLTGEPGQLRDLVLVHVEGQVSRPRLCIGIAYWGVSGFQRFQIIVKVLDTPLAGINRATYSDVVGNVAREINFYAVGGLHDRLVYSRADPFRDLQQ